MALELWDCSGQDSYKTVCSMYYRDADGAVVVYDTTDDNSFNDLKAWISELEEKAPKDIKIIIVGNKGDLVEKEKVSLKQV